MYQTNNNIGPKSRRDKDGPIKETAVHTGETKKYITPISSHPIPVHNSQTLFYSISMAVESLSTMSRPNDDRSAIVFGGFTRSKQPSVRDDGATVSQIEWFSIDVPDADSHYQKQKLNSHLCLSKHQNKAPSMLGILCPFGRFFFFSSSFVLWLMHKGRGGYG